MTNGDLLTGSYRYSVISLTFVPEKLRFPKNYWSYIFRLWNNWDIRSRVALSMPSWPNG